MPSIRPSFSSSPFKVGALVLALGALALAQTQVAPSRARADGVARKDTLVIPIDANVPAPDIWNP